VSTIEPFFIYLQAFFNSLRLILMRMTFRSFIRNSLCLIFFSVDPIDVSILQVVEFVRFFSFDENDRGRRQMSYLRPAKKGHTEQRDCYLSSFFFSWMIYYVLKSELQSSDLLFDVLD
jgi:hypothetical protein